MGPRMLWALATVVLLIAAGTDTVHGLRCERLNESSCKFHDLHCCWTDAWYDYEYDTVVPAQCHNITALFPLDPAKPGMCVFVQPGFYWKQPCPPGTDCSTPCPVNTIRGGPDPVLVEYALTCAPCEPGKSTNGNLGQTKCDYLKKGWRCAWDFHDFCTTKPCAANTYSDTVRLIREPDLENLEQCKPCTCSTSPVTAVDFDRQQTTACPVASMPRACDPTSGACVLAPCDRTIHRKSWASARKSTTCTDNCSMLPCWRGLNWASTSAKLVHVTDSRRAGLRVGTTSSAGVLTIKPPTDAPITFVSLNMSCPGFRQSTDKIRLKAVTMRGTTIIKHVIPGSKYVVPTSLARLKSLEIKWVSSVAGRYLPFFINAMELSRC